MWFTNELITSVIWIQLQKVIMTNELCLSESSGELEKN
jgi:hypothetical protein